MNKPAISTLEFTNNCQFNCPYCQNRFSDGQRKHGYLDIELVRTMIGRGDFDNTLYLEFQQNGEPTMHPQFNELVTMLRAAVPFIGMSSNGNIKDESVISGLSLLDCLTLSVHPQTTTKDLLHIITEIRKRSDKTKIRVQTLDNNFHNVDKNTIADIAYIDNFDIREFGHVYGQKKDCIDLHSSVSVQWDGDVVPCCNCVGKQRVIGNVNNESIEQLWQRYDHSMFEYCNTCRTNNIYLERLNFFWKTKQSDK